MGGYKVQALDPSFLSGYDCPIPIDEDESFDSNYRLFKQQNGKVFTRYTDTNCRIGSPNKKIWVKNLSLKTYLLLPI